MAEEPKKEEPEKKVVHTYPLIVQSDMSEEFRIEVSEVAVTACEKFASNNEGAARMIKETLDKKFGPSWHVVVGEGFGFYISYESTKLLYMFFGGTVAVVMWKCS